MLRCGFWAVQVWDLVQCKCTHTLTGHTKPVQRLEVHGSRLYSVGGRAIRAWDLNTFECVGVLRTRNDCGSLCGLSVDAAGLVYVGGQVGLGGVCVLP